MKKIQNKYKYKKIKSFTDAVSRLINGMIKKLNTLYLE